MVAKTTQKKVDPKKAAKLKGKTAKKKWSKGKVKEKVAKAVVFTQAEYDNMLKDVAGYKLITPSVVSDRLKITGSLARRAIADLEASGTIRPLSTHHSQLIYTRVN
eukprot:CAMPEP_0177634444 /NCGR_PEP_ID=MMETSP0447-20121125/3372_1 /TAXON_ID=0 /ORGANISM="Stygamoeba regulata, Strain BSH-02190019" /LENGTH=105 /DNA_ID=CAMNT_0019136167 /DNA_START=77 /DNA_END=394 /DNA_ORIENTATION=+